MTDFTSIIIDALDTLRKVDVAENRPFPARAYAKVITQIKAYGKEITTIDDINGITGIGSKIRVKIEEIINTGSLKSAEKAKKNTDVPIQLYDDLQKVYGIGPVKASVLIKENGIKSITDLRERLKTSPSLLNEKQTIGLTYYEDINERISRSEMDKHNKYLLTIGSSFIDYDEIQIVGSYRRGAETSGDIDVLLRGYTDKDFKLYIKHLKDNKYIVATLAEGPKKYMAVVCLPGEKKRRLDILSTSYEEFPYSLLYFTGSDLFNVAMRKHAITMGYTMNEYGMTPIKRDDGIIKPNAPTMNSEEDIFHFLKLYHIHPTQRTGPEKVVYNFNK